MALPSTTPANLPAHLQTGTARGNENVSAEDISIPRIKLLQKMSPELDEGDARYIAEAKAGHLLNSVTNEIMDEVYVMNLFYEKGFTVFKKRDLGGGLFGSFQSKYDAEEALRADGLDVSEYDITETATHTLLMLDEDGNITMPAIMDYASSKLKVSRAWNTDIAMKCGGQVDRFAAIYRLTSKLEKNRKGQGYHNIDFEFSAWANEEQHAEASQNFDRMQASKGLPQAA